MNLLYKAAALWILSLVAAGPIPLALHVAICHEHGESQAATESCSHDHDHHSHAHTGHSHASHSHSEHGIVLAAGGHDHECGVCQTLSQTASIDSIVYELGSQLLAEPARVATGEVYLSAAGSAYQGRGPPSSLLV